MVSESFPKDARMERAENSGTSSKKVLPTISWPTNLGIYITTFHLKLSTARQLPGLLEYLDAAFANVVEDGRRYPREGDMRGEAFEKHFLAVDNRHAWRGDTKQQKCYS